jgi:hypothetical protein
MVICTLESGDKVKDGEKELILRLQVKTITLEDGGEI